MRMIYRCLALAIFSFVLTRVPHLVQSAPAPIVPVAADLASLAQPADGFLQALKAIVDPTNETF